MAQITHAIGSRAFELIRNQIGAILADELPAQATLNNDVRLNAEVFVERFVPVDDAEVPLVIVGFSDVDMGLKTASSVDGNMTFLIDCYEKAKATTADPQADKTAAIRLQRLIGVIHGILSHSRYRTLGFSPPFIEHTEVKEIKMAAPKNATDASSVVMARLEFIVRAPDKNIPIYPVVLAGYTTQALLGLTALGYTYGNYTGSPVGPVCAGVDIRLNGIEIVNAESGAIVEIPIVDENDVVVGTWDGMKFVVPAGGGGGGFNTSDLMATGENISYITNDDGDKQFGRDFLILEYNNPYGDTERFKDDLGTQIYSSDVILDWSTWNQVNNTVLAYYRILEGSNSAINHINSQPFTKNLLSNWWMVNNRQLYNAFNHSIFRNYLNYSPFNIVVSATSDRIWTSNFESPTFCQFFYGRGMSQGAISSTYRAFLCRTYTLTELGL